MHLFSCSFHQYLRISGTYSGGGNIYYVQISNGNAEVRCSREHIKPTVLLISLIRKRVSLLLWVLLWL